MMNATPIFLFCFPDQYWNGAFVNQPSQEASIVYARRHRYLPLPLPLRIATPYVMNNEKFLCLFLKKNEATTFIYNTLSLTVML